MIMILIIAHGPMTFMNNNDITVGAWTAPATLVRSNMLLSAQTTNERSEASGAGPIAEDGFLESMMPHR